MLTASISALPHDTSNYGAEDLEAMRHAFRRACDENPLDAKTEAQCYNLANAIVKRYRQGISETELIAIALLKAH